MIPLHHQIKKENNDCFDTIKTKKITTVITNMEVIIL